MRPHCVSRSLGELRRGARTQSAREPSPSWFFVAGGWFPARFGGGGACAADLMLFACAARTRRRTTAVVIATCRQGEPIRARVLRQDGQGFGTIPAPRRYMFLPAAAGAPGSQKDLLVVACLSEIEKQRPTQFSFSFLPTNPSTNPPTRTASLN